MFDAILRTKDKIVHIYAVDTHIDAFLIDDNGRFRWLSRNEFVPISAMYTRQKEDDENNE